MTADGSGVDHLCNGDVNRGDLGISGSMGGVSFTATTSISKGDDNQSYSLGNTMGDLTLSYVCTNNSDGPGENASKMSVSYKMDAMTVSYTAASTGESGSNINDDYDVSVSYTAGALTASIATDEDSVSKISASYDLGGGVNAFFVNRNGTDSANANKDFQAVGINFAF